MVVLPGRNFTMSNGALVKQFHTHIVCGQESCVLLYVCSCTFGFTEIAKFIGDLIRLAILISAQQSNEAQFDIFRVGDAEISCPPLTANNVKKYFLRPQNLCSGVCRIQTSIVKIVSE